MPGSTTNALSSAASNLIPTAINLGSNTLTDYTNTASMIGNMENMYHSQLAMMGVEQQIQTGIANAQAAATTAAGVRAMGLQVINDTVKLAKDAVKGAGDAAQKAS